MALLTLHAAADYLGTTPRHARDLAYHRGLPYVKVGHLVRFDTDDLDAWIAANRKVRS